VGSRVAVWALNDKKRKGHAPSSLQVWEAERAGNCRSRSQVGGEMSATPPKRIALWAFRRCCRWCFKRLKIRAREGVDLEAVQRNAPAGITENRTLALKSAPKKGPYSGPVLDTAEPKL